MKELEECLWCDTISGVQGQVGSDEERGAGRLRRQMLSVGAKEKSIGELAQARSLI